MIDIVIPTMWIPKNFENSLMEYVDHPAVNRVIIIDNNQKNRPEYAVLSHKKIKIISYGRNIFVNPAWNEGYRVSSSPVLAVVNDDIIVSKSVFDMVSNFKFEIGDIIGVSLQGRVNNYRIDDYIATEEKIIKLDYNRDEPIGGQAWAFGICMFMLRETYKPIPSLYQVWYGDDYLLQSAKTVYVVRSNQIKGNISDTLTKSNQDIDQRLYLDSRNLLKFDHFRNGKNWDIPQHIVSNFEKKPKRETDILTKEYNSARLTKSDINEHITVLYDLAKECRSVTEFGVRYGASTRAFLNADVRLRSYDLELDARLIKLFEQAKQLGKDVEYIKADVRNIKIDPVDLLFIDTLHTYEQLKIELKLHANSALKYIVFHDTYTFGLTGELPNDRRGLLTAILEFLSENSNWKIKIHKINNNGLTVLERVNNHTYNKL